ncbi:glycosyl transferase family 1 [Gemmatimonadetes bacterium T265]|nr:glycosyl transferase family 1 [Gemmatimonadetes bacterium T265]
MIQFVSHLDGDGGWKRHATGLARALDRYERTELLGVHEPTRRGVAAAVRRWRVRRSRDSVGITLGAVERTAELGTRFRVAFGVAETTRIARPVRLLLHAADMVWTMSHWGRDVLAWNTIPAERIRIVPAGVDTTEFVPPARPRADPVFRFLCVGEWQERKGTAALVRAFAAEFDPREPVELVMHCGSNWTRRVHFREAIRRIVAASARGRARVVPSDPVSRAAYVALLQGADAFVLATRGEGWGLPILEAMACGLPCIVTDYSAVRDFANASNAYLIPVDAMERADDRGEFVDPRYEYGLWAIPDEGHLRRLLRHVVEHREEARRVGAQARRDAVRYWSWDLAARAALRHVAELRGGAVPSDHGAASRG